MIVGFILEMIARIFIGGYARWIGCRPTDTQRIYFANHSSHADLMAIWLALPAHLRKRVHPVAAYDYWNKSAFRRHIVVEGLNGVFVKRSREEGSTEDPLQPLYDTLAKGDSLILFPEGTRYYDDTPQPFKSGIYHLAQRFPEVELVPVYLENMRRSLPKGEYWPIPLVCTARFGTPIHVQASEDKDAFLERARQSVIDARRTPQTSSH